MRLEFRVPPPPHLHPLASYALAVLLPLAALAVQHLMRDWIENIPFVLFFVVVSIVASMGGAGPGIATVAVSAVSGWWFQATSLDPSNRAGALVGALVFVPAGLAIAALGALVRAGLREREKVAQELSDAIRARDEFISVASHELKTPLTSLSLSVHRLERPELGDVTLGDPRVARALSLISRQAGRLNILVSNLLDVSRISSGRLHLDLREFDAAEVVRDVASRFEDELAQVGSTLTLTLPGPVVGRWDRLRLEQVLTNLLSNAVKFGSGRPLEVSAGADGGVAVLAVTDRGIGIAERDQQRIFERFERVADGGSSSGLGLGLWIVREIVTALDGTVRVESAVGKGTTFTVRLPVRGPAQVDAGR
jgi:signal transduction histidine kinase